MKLNELAELMNISKEELIDQMKNNDVIELKLTEKARKQETDNSRIEVMG